MTSQVIVNIDTKLKNRAMKRAKNQGTTLSFILRLALKDYADGKIEMIMVRKSD